MKSMELQKSQFLNSLVNWEKVEEQPRLIFKNPNFRFLQELGNIRCPARATFKNLEISLLIGKNLEVELKTNTQKIPILHLWMIWKKF